MAAKSALAKILGSGAENRNVFGEAIVCAREYHMGVSALEKLRVDLFGKRGVDQAEPATVESAVRDLVACSQLGRRHCPGTANQPNMNDSSSQGKAASTDVDVDGTESPEFDLDLDSMESTQANMSSASGRGTTIMIENANQAGGTSGIPHEQDSDAGSVASLELDSIIGAIVESSLPVTTTSISTGAKLGVSMETKSSVTTPGESVGGQPIDDGDSVPRSTASSATVVTGTQTEPLAPLDSQLSPVARPSTAAPSPEDFSKLLAGLQKLQGAFAEFVVESADREVRYTQKLTKLSAQVQHLTSTLHAERQEAKSREERSAKKIAGLSSRLGDLTSAVKKRGFDVSPSPATGDGSSPRELHHPLLPLGPPQREQNQPPLAGPPEPCQPRNGITSEKSAHSAAPNDHTELHNGNRNGHRVIAKLTADNVVQDQAGLHVSGRSVWADISPNVVDADAAENRAGVPSEWQEVPQRHKRKASPSTSSLAGITRKSSAPAQVFSGQPLGGGDGRGMIGARRVKKKVFYLGGIAPGCSADDVVGHCSDLFPILSCRMLPSRRFGTQAARIVVGEDEAHLVEAADTWPEHVHARAWDFQ